MKVSAAKSDDLSSVPCAHVLEGETDSQKLFSDIHAPAMGYVPRPHTCDKKIFIFNYLCSVGMCI